MTPEQISGAIDLLRTAMAKRKIPKALLVEDNADDRFQLLRLLQGFVCEVQVVTNGEDAVAALNGHDLDLVLLDLKLPILPGVEVLKQTRNLDPNTHFIAVTGFKNSTDVDEALRQGACLVLEKPVSEEKLASFLAAKPTPTPTPLPNE